MPLSVLERSFTTPGGAVSVGEVSPAFQSLSSMTAQKRWAARPIGERLDVLRAARHLLASRSEALCGSIPSTLTRNAADTRCAELLPLLAACKFLEQRAASILKPRYLGRGGRPFWLSGTTSKVHRVPMGRLLVVAPSNYPLFIPGVQVLQALAAGNSAIWKPGLGGRAIALLVAEALCEAGLPRDLLQVTDESVHAAQDAIAHGVDKVFFTGSAVSGRKLLHQLAETLTPCVTELSGCDAVFVLPSADLLRVVKALAFGMRLNGSATCMAPRRVILINADTARREKFIDSLKTALARIAGVPLSDTVQRELRRLVSAAQRSGAELHGELTPFQQPVLVTGASAAMDIAQADIFAPVLTLLNARDTAGAVALHELCPFALTASVFGSERDARALAGQLTAGTVLINDLIISAADPRTPFGGRQQSGFGVTQGAEGLLEMTVPKTVTVRRGSSTRNYDATTAAHEQLFEGVIQMGHGGTLRQRFAGIKQMISAAKRVSGKQ